MRDGTGFPKFTGVDIVQMPLGGGGQVTLMQCYPLGTKLMCGDVENGWIMPQGKLKYERLYTSLSMPAGAVGVNQPDNSLYTGVGPNNYTTAYAVAIAPSNENKLYGFHNGLIFKSANVQSSSRTFTQLTGGPFYANSAGNGTNLRWLQNRMAVNPANENIFMAGPMEDKVVYSTDGSTLTTITLSLNSFTASIAVGATLQASISGTTMTVSSVFSGTIAIGQVVTGAAVGTTITAGSGTTWTVSVSQTLASSFLSTHTMTVSAFGSGDAIAVNHCIRNAAQNNNPGTIVTNTGTGAGGTGTYGVNIGAAITSTTFHSFCFQRLNQPPPHLVAFDPTSSKCCYTIEGKGIYESTTGPGGTFALLTGSPQYPNACFYDPNGNLWGLNAGESVGGNIYKKTPAGSFGKITTGLGDFETDLLAAHPSNGNILVGSDSNGAVFLTKNAGTSWQGRWGLPQQSFNSDVAWVGRQRGKNWHNGVSIGAVVMAIDYNGRCYIGEGFGSFYFDISTVTTPTDEMVWHFDCKGFELCETSNIVCIPGGDTWASHHDRGPCKYVDDTNYTNLTHFGNNGLSNSCFIPQDSGPYPNNSCWWIDYVGNASGPTAKLIQGTHFFDDGSGQSNDGGRTWIQLSVTNIYPCQTISPQDGEIYIFPSMGAQPIYSLNGMGGPWNNITEFTPLSGLNGFNQAYWNPARTVTLDRATGTMWAFCWDNLTSGTAKGVWKKPLGGSWTKVFSGAIDASWVGTVGGRLHFMPGTTDTLFHTANFASPIWRSSGTNGATWASIPNTTFCGPLGFGKAAPGQSTPAVYFNGEVSSVWGIWVSFDNFATTPKFICDYPLGIVDNIVWLEGSWDNFGEFWIALGHSGVLRARLKHTFAAIN